MPNHTLTSIPVIVFYIESPLKDLNKQKVQLKDLGKQRKKGVKFFLAVSSYLNFLGNIAKVQGGSGGLQSDGTGLDTSFCTVSRL